MLAFSSLGQTNPEDFQIVAQLDDGVLVGVDFKDAKIGKDSVEFSGLVFHNKENYTITVFATDCSESITVLSNKGLEQGEKFDRPVTDPKPTKIPEKTLIAYAVNQVCGQHA